jgi:DNA repair ATPase RecN
MFNRPLVDLWLLNTFWNRLSKNTTEAEYNDLEDAKAKLEDYNNIHELMHYTSELCDRAVLIMLRQDTAYLSTTVNVYRSSWHNQIEQLFCEVEAIIHAYYDLIDQCKGNEAWITKIEQEAGAQIAYLATSMDETSRDYLVEHSETYRLFDADKHKFFK